MRGKHEPRVYRHLFVFHPRRRGGAQTQAVQDERVLVAPLPEVLVPVRSGEMPRRQGLIPKGGGIY
jgi:hypothetical protein